MQQSIIINTNLFEILPLFIKNRLLSYRKQFKESYTNQFRKLYLFKQHLQKLSHNLSYVISELIYHIIKKKGNGSFVVQIISEAIKNIIMNVHFFIVLQVIDIITTDAPILTNSDIKDYFNKYAIYHTYRQGHLGLIRKIYYSDQSINNEDFHRIGFATKAGIYHRVVIDLASFDLLERLQAGRQYHNLDSVFSKRTWYTKCIPQIVSSFLDHITFRENIPCRKSEDLVGFSMNDYVYLGIN